MAGPATNWAGNVRFSAGQVHRPESVEQVRRLVAAASRVRALGSAHSFSTIADTTGELVSVAGLPAGMVLDPEAGTVSVGAGVRYGELARWLHQRGYALHNLGSLPHISVAGACSTGTHGSGDRNGGLGTAVAALELVTADGESVTVARGDQLEAAVVGLGALGVVTRVTLEVEPTYEVRQYLYEEVGWDELTGQLAEIFGSGYSVSVFTDWGDPPVSQLWVKLRADQPTPNLPGRPAGGERHPIAGYPAGNCTPQLGVPGPWHERLPHFRLEFTPSSGAELQSEYLVPRESAVGALRAVREIGRLVAPVLQVSELRSVAADELWLSPAYGRASIAIHFTWIADGAAVAPVVAAVEERLAPFGPRPHWGKVFGLPPEAVRDEYPRAADFQRLRASWDPAGKFGNELVDRYLPGG
jgi:xylitol oxidase